MHRRGFTLIELLVVVAIIGILSALLGAGIQKARAKGQSAVCLNNLRQMVMSAHSYAMNNDDRLPPAVERNLSTKENRTWESFLWDLGSGEKVQQCPSYSGSANWEEDAFTGYNYNASYVGGTHYIKDGRLHPLSTPSTRLSQIEAPAFCALFGDGEYEGGANKFMRSPKAGSKDIDAGLALGGTQGFRHLGRTNVGFADGHTESLEERFVPSSAGDRIPSHCGFLSEDNAMYDLE